MEKAVTYYRVSTARQGISGLGLEAQRKAVCDFAEANGFVLVREFTEVESGAKSARPVLQQALRICARQNATLLIAKLDRLTRNVAFVARLLESRVNFKAIDNPNADKFSIHILAAIAERERDQISKRTKDSLAAAKRRGVVLGQHGRYVLSGLNRAQADAFARGMEPLIARLRAQGITTLRAIASELNRLCVPTYRSNGHKWHRNSVHRMICRMEQS